MKFLACLVFLAALVFPLAANATSAGGDCVEPYEAEVVRLINVERKNHGLRALAISDTLSASAEHMVQDMSHYGYNGHYLHDGTPWNTNQRRHGYTYNTYRGQNVGAGQTTPARIVAAWMNSPTHKAVILNPKFVVIGVGYTRNTATYYQRFWTAGFGGYRDAAANSC